MKKLSVICAIVFTPLSMPAIDFTVENINRFGVDKPTISVSSLGVVHMSGSNTTAQGDIVSYIRGNLGSWQKDSLMISVVPMTGYNARVSSALGSDGTMHILYRVTGGTYGWPVYANNSGGSFIAADTLTKNSSQSTYEYGLALDSLNRAHIVCSIYQGGTFNVRYYRPSDHVDSLVAASASWGTITVGRGNVVHMAYGYPYSSPKIYYVNNAKGYFGTPVLVSDTVGRDPSIAVDSLGRAYICWTQSNGGSVSDCFYADNKSGTFQTTRVASTPSLNEAYSHIALSRTSVVGIVYNLWNTSPYSSDIMFAYKLDTSTTFTTCYVADGNSNPSYGAITWNDKALAFDQFGYVHLGYDGLNGTSIETYYAKSQTMVGIEEQSDARCSILDARLRILQNPTTTRQGVRLLANSHLPNARLQIYDISGSLVQSFALGRSPLASRPITLHLESGVYFIQLETAGNVATSKVVVLE